MLAGGRIVARHTSYTAFPGVVPGQRMLSAMSMAWSRPSDVSSR
jgi:hypothetical protein